MNDQFKLLVKTALSDLKDDTVTTPISIRLPSHLNDQLDELALSLDKPKSYLLVEFVKAGIETTDNILREEEQEEQERALEDIEQGAERSATKAFLLNTNYRNNKNDHKNMLQNKEAAAFYSSTKKSICRLQKGDSVYLYQSGVGFVASGIVEGDLIKDDHGGSADAKYSKALGSFKTGFQAITAKEFKKLVKHNPNFMRTLVELDSEQKKALDIEIDKRLAG